jgi:uncharacterized protein (DUF362 family)
MLRRDFVKAASFTAAQCLLGPAVVAANEPSEFAIVKKGSAAAMTRKAVELLGGMNRMVKPGQIVAIKPNMSWARPPELAANTNPEVVAEVVKMCLEVGARKVWVFDRTIDDPVKSYQISGIAKAAGMAGAEVPYVEERLCETVKIEDGFQLKEYKFYRPALEADLLINIPVLKRHHLTLVSMGFKNMMGLVGDERSRFHGSFDKMIVDIHRVLRPRLTILDANRALLQNGPQGGSIADAFSMKTVIAGVDPVLVEMAGAKLIGANPKSLPFLKLAEQAGLGSTDLVAHKPIEFSF